MERVVGFSETFNEKIDVTEFIVAMDLLEQVKFSTKNLSNATKCSFMCTLFDVLFKEKSVEAAELCLERIKKVNEGFGTYK